MQGIKRLLDPGGGSQSGKGIPAPGKRSGNIGPMKARHLNMEHLHAVRQELKKCTKCGECCSVCPIFKESREEKFVARGKLSLAEAIINQEIRPTSGVHAILNNCLLCLSCVDNCGSGVRVDKIVLAARADLTAHRGVPFLKRLVFSILRSSKGVVDFVFRSGSLAQYLLFKRIPDSSGSSADSRTSGR